MKARARADHWDEELILVREEMQRVLQYTIYKSDWWMGQAERRQDAMCDLLDGLQALQIPNL